MSNDFFAALDAKHQAMAQVEANANEEWKARMLECVILVAKMKKIFTSDDVFALATARGWDKGTHDKRAFGPVMMRAASAGVCQKANCAPINSKRVTLHASPRAVWESLLYAK